jgi:hypothetical protein
MQVAARSHSRWINVVTLALIQNILCVIQKEKRTKQSNYFREKTSLSQIHKFKLLQLVHKVHLGLHSEKKKHRHSIINWDMHDESWLFTYNTPQKSLSHIIPKIQSYSLTWSYEHQYHATQTFIDIAYSCTPNFIVWTHMVQHLFLMGHNSDVIKADFAGSAKDWSQCP